MDDRDRLAVEWLLASDEPAVRHLTRHDVLDEPENAAEAASVLAGSKVRTLLAGQRPDGGFGVHPYHKWTGAFWRLISLTELAVPPDEPHAVPAAETVLDWLTGDLRRRKVRVVAGLVRRCAAQEGYGLAVACRLGLARDPRVEWLARSLVEWQWPDGGWNCDPRATGCRSSFHESLGPMWGLHEYWAATGELSAKEAAARTAELLLEHRLFRSLRTGAPIHPSWIALHYPPYWHYDILHALSVLTRVGRADDPRADDAIEVLERRRLQDGRWRPGGYWWRSPGTDRGNDDVVDWGRSGPNEMITLNALRVRRRAGRLRLPVSRR